MTDDRFQVEAFEDGDVVVIPERASEGSPVEDAVVWALAHLKAGDKGRVTPPPYQNGISAKSKDKAMDNAANLTSYNIRKHNAEAVLGTIVRKMPDSGITSDGIQVKPVATGKGKPVEHYTDKDGTVYSAADVTPVPGLYTLSIVRIDAKIVGTRTTKKRT